MKDALTNKAIKLLLIEDSENDAKLIIREFQKAGYFIEYELVFSQDKVIEALKLKEFDIIISDYNLPNFNGLSVLKISKDMGIDIPFILVSGAIGEEAAVEAMKYGVSDYIMKSSLKRLVPAIEREIKEYKIIKNAEKQRLQSIALSNEAEIKKIEALQLIDEASKMASIGIITSSITHEINQPLNAIRLGAEGILHWNKINNDILPVRITSMLLKISNAANKIDEIVKHMRLLITDEEQVEYQKVDLNACVYSAITLVNNKLASQEIFLKFETDSEELFIQANHLQMELIINNLIQNAAQSLSETANTDKRIVIKSYKNSDKIFFEVEDNGVGLPDVPIVKLFTPMFSTKKLKGGSGLGLAIVDRFLKKINAEITAKNNEGIGATFTITFNEYSERVDN